MINKVILTGRLTQDVELRRTNDGTPYAFFTIAVNRRQQDQTDFISCTAWRQTAELMAQYLNKGSLVGVEGSLQVFTQQREGQYDTRTTVQVSQITFLESRAQAQARTQEQAINPNQGNSYNNVQEQPPMTFDAAPSFDQTETTPVPAQNNAGSQEQQRTVNPNEINLSEIKF